MAICIQFAPRFGQGPFNTVSNDVSISRKNSKCLISQQTANQLLTDDSKISSADSNTLAAFQNTASLAQITTPTRDPELSDNKGQIVLPKANDINWGQEFKVKWTFDHKPKMDWIYSDQTEVFLGRGKKDIDNDPSISGNRKSYVRIKSTSSLPLVRSS